MTGPRVRLGSVDGRGVVKRVKGAVSGEASILKRKTSVNVAFTREHRGQLVRRWAIV